MANNKTLSPEALEARRAYLRKWQQEHPEKMREYAKRYWERIAAEQRTKQ